MVVETNLIKISTRWFSALQFVDLILAVFVYAPSVSQSLADSLQGKFRIRVA